MGETRFSRAAVLRPQPSGDAYIQGKVGTPAINGAGAQTPWGTFNLPPLP